MASNPTKLKIPGWAIFDGMTTSPQDPVEHYLDLETGAVEVIDHYGDDLGREEEGESLAARIARNRERYARIPRVRGEYDWMREFADSIDEDDIRAQLDVALRGKGSFGRFRDVVFRHPDLRARWLAMRQGRLVEHARQWLAELEIDAELELPRIEPAPAPSPARATAIDLVDMLLLGAPDGKTELIDGRVLRQVTLESDGLARRTFRDLAKNLCEYYGLAWRKRFAEGQSSFDIERAHLSVHGRHVQLAVDVPRKVWDRFSR